MTQKKSESQEKPEVKEKSTSKDKAESNDKSASKGKPASKEKSPSKEKTANKAKLTSKIKLDKPELNKFTVGGLVVLMLVILGGFFLMSKSDTGVGPDDLEAEEVDTLFTPDEPVLTTNVAIKGDNNEPYESEGNDLSTDIKRLEPQEYLVMADEVIEDVAEPIVSASSNVLIDTEGLLARYDTVGPDSRGIFMDMDTYKIWRKNHSELKVAGRHFYLDPVFIIMEEDLEKLSQEVSKAKDGKFKLSLHVSTSHTFFKQAALRSLKQRLSEEGVTDANTLTLQNLHVIPPTKLKLYISEVGWATNCYNESDGVNFTFTFDNREAFNKFSKALKSGNSTIKYSLYGQTVKPLVAQFFHEKTASMFNEMNSDSQVNDSGFVKEAAESSGWKTFGFGGGNVGLGSQPGMLFFDFDVPEYHSSDIKMKEEQKLRRDIGIDGEDFNKRLIEMCTKSAVFVDTPEGTTPEVKRQLMDDLAAYLNTSIDCGKLEEVHGQITKFGDDNHDFEVMLKEVRKEDLMPSEITSIKDVLNSTFNEAYSKGRRNKADVSYKDWHGVTDSGNTDAGNKSGQTSADSTSDGKIRLPVSFKFYRVGKFFLTNKIENKIQEDTWVTGYYPAANGFISVCKEIKEKRGTYEFKYLKETLVGANAFGLASGNGCLSNETEFTINSSVNATNSPTTDSINFTFEVDATYSGNGTTYSFPKKYPVNVPRTKVGLSDSDPGAVFQFIQFVDKNGNKSFDNGEVIRGSHRESNYNHGPANYGNFPRDSKTINLLHGNLSKHFDLLEARGEDHEYKEVRDGHEFIWHKTWFGGYPEYVTKWKQTNKCRTKDRVSLKFHPYFRYTARTHLPMLEMTSNKGTLIMLDTNCDGAYNEVVRNDPRD